MRPARTVAVAVLLLGIIPGAVVVCCASALAAQRTRSEKLGCIFEWIRWVVRFSRTVSIRFFTANSTANARQTGLHVSRDHTGTPSIQLTGMARLSPDGGRHVVD